MNSFCTNCGSPLAVGRDFCTNCGTPRGSADRPASAEITRPLPSTGPSTNPVSLAKEPVPAQTGGPLTGAPRQRNPSKVPVGLAALLAVLLIGGGALGGAYVLLADRDGSDTATGSDSSQGAAASNETLGESGRNRSSDQTPSANAPAPSTSDGADAVPDAQDPLDLGFALENQPCSGDYVVILASSGEPVQWRTTLRPALRRSPGSRYLLTDESCGAFAQDLAGERIFAAYVGVFASLADACAARSTLPIDDAYVRQLDRERPERDLCSCQESPSVLPALNRGQDSEPTLERGFAVVDVQALLFRAGINKDAVLAPAFGPKTVAWVRQFQRQEFIGANGVVGPETWGLLQSYC